MASRPPIPPRPPEPADPVHDPGAAFFEAVSRAAPVGIFHADLAGAITYANPRLEAMFELDESALGGLGWTERVHPDDLPGLVAAWMAANQAGEEYERVFRLRLPDGRIRWVHGRSAIVRTGHGQPGRCVGTVDDITADREAEERTQGLLAISAALARAFTAVDVARAVAQHAERVVGASSSMVTLTTVDGQALALVGVGGLPSDVRGSWERFPLSTRLPVIDTLRTGEPVLLASPEAMERAYPDAMPLWRRIGAQALATFPLEFEGRRFGVIAFRFPAPQRFRGDDLAFLRAVVQQCAVSLERARLFDEARAAREEADEANRAKGEFLARMSHELRTPLNAIAGHLQLVEMGLHGPVTPAQQEAFDRVGRAQRHLLGLINDVLNLARLESGRVEFTLRPTAVADVLADVRPMVEPQLAAKGLSFSVRLPEQDGGEPVLVWADHEKLAQILLNLLANAIKFTPEGGHVSVELAPVAGTGEQAMIVVRDTGIGIPTARLEAVFEPFVQVHAGLTRRHEGTGLGLAISRDLARGMNGDLSADSAEGQGSAFALRLRRAVTADGQHTDRRNRDTRRTGGDRRSGADRRHE